MANVVISGDTSGSITLSAPAVSGTTTITLPNTTGTMAYVNATSFLPAYNGSALTSVNASQLQGFTVGTSANNIVQLNASGQLPAVSGALLTNLPAASVNGALIRSPQWITSGTSYTTPAGCNNILVELVSGGGGGGGTGSPNRSSGGGGQGIYGIKYAAVTPNTTYTIAVGAGGTGGVQSGTGGTAGGTGGNTSITIGATTYLCTGGTGGGPAAPTVFGTAGVGGTGINVDSTITGVSPVQNVPTGGTCYVAFNVISGSGTGGTGAPNNTAPTGVAGRAGSIRIWEYS